MFVTFPQYRFLFPPGLNPPEANHWQAVHLSPPSHWYIVVHRQNSSTKSQIQTTFVIWEENLLNMLKTFGSLIILQIGRFDLADDSRWGVRWMDVVYESCADNLFGEDAIAFKLEGENCIRDASMECLLEENKWNPIFRRAGDGQ